LGATTLLYAPTGASRRHGLSSPGALGHPGSATDGGYDAPVTGPVLSGGERDPLDYLRGIRRGWWVILLSVVVVLVVAVAVTVRQQKVYRATGELLLQPPTNPLNPTQPSASAAFVPTQIRILESPAVADIVREKLGPNGGVRGAQLGNTTIVELAAESPDPARAAAIVNAYANAYIELVRDREATAVLELSDELNQKIGEIDAEIAVLDAQVNNAAPENKQSVTNATAGERARLIDQRSVYREKLDEQSFSSIVDQGGNQVVREAVPAGSPVRPTPRRNAALALGFGLVLGIALALLFDRFNDTIRNREDLERALAGSLVPILGHVPASTKAKRPQVTSLVEPMSPAAEAYRSLRTSVQFLAVDGGIGTIQITSPIAAEGKTTTAANLAVVLSRAGRRVLVLDADLRRPRIHEYFDLPNEVGLTSVLIGDAPIADALQPVYMDDQLPLVLMASGPLPLNPSELLASESARNVMQTLRAYADIVIVDCPPVLPVTDAAIVSTMVDATILVAMVGLTTRKRTHRAMEKLAQVDANLVGLVLNRTPAEFEYAYGYQHYGRRERMEPGVTKAESLDSELH
jgi:capsular exopolysaccharide synthesis family protein